MREGLAERLACSIGGRLLTECRWPWPAGIRLGERLVVGIVAGLLFFASFRALIVLAELFDANGRVSLFFPIAGLCLLFGYGLGPAYLVVPIIGMVLAEGWSVSPAAVEGAMPHVARQVLLYGAAGALLRAHFGRRRQVTASYRLGALICIACGAVLANLAVALALFIHEGSLSGAALPGIAMIFMLGDLSGLLLVVPPALLLLDRLDERRRGARRPRLATLRDRLTVLGLLMAATVFVVIALVSLDGGAGIPLAMTPALLPILFGAMLFGYGVGVALFSVAAAVLLAVAATIADPPSALAVQTMLVVCGVATLAVGAATSDRTRLIARLDASVAERTRLLDARNARLIKVNAELKAAASTDHLTRLPNRRAFDRAMALRLAAPERDFGLLLIDVDRFKRINDIHGHAAGDHALVHVARLLTAAVRNGDFVARIGGEEFAVLCRAAGADELRGLADRLRRAVRATPLRAGDAGDRLDVRVSIGAAVAGPGDDADSLLRAADRALYSAKRAGRDRTRLADRSADRQEPIVVAGAAGPGPGGR